MTPRSSYSLEVCLSLYDRAKAVRLEVLATKDARLCTHEILTEPSLLAQSMEIFSSLTPDMVPTG